MLAKINSKLLVGFIFLTLIVCLIGCGMFGMFQSHTYNWKTGMPSLKDQVTTFQQANKRWPKDYDDLVFYMKQTITNYVPESYDRIDFTTKSDGNLEIDVYVFNAGTTNRIILKTFH
jgi:hypothetical protein